ncbi:hypothetical protein AB0F24_17520 [Streptomyces platensis]|uniref:hypothetical protein n=1 Tax=Streptomyces platensis TaxID=58346 RepID=UPI0033D2EEDF
MTPAMALTINWTEHDNLTPREQYEAAGTLIDEAKALVAARRCRIAHDLAQERGAAEAAAILGISDKRIYQLAARYRQSQPVVASNIPGRSIHPYDLLDEVMEQTGMGKREAHDSIHALLDQLAADDGEDAVILHREPVRPELLKSNPSDVDVYYWLTIRQETADLIREALAAQCATD